MGPQSSWWKLQWSSGFFPWWKLHGHRAPSFGYNRGESLLKEGTRVTVFHHRGKGRKRRCTKTHWSMVLAACATKRQACEKRTPHCSKLHLPVESRTEASPLSSLSLFDTPMKAAKREDQKHNPFHESRPERGPNTEGFGPRCFYRPRGPFERPQVGAPAAYRALASRRPRFALGRSPLLTGRFADGHRGSGFKGMSSFIL